MKYGLLYFKETANIGDDIQTYVAKQFLPRVDYLVDRESLNCFVPDEREYVSVIMNAWYMYNKSAWPPSPYINPLLISMHFTQDDIYDVGDKYLSGEAAKYLNKYGPVGARDESTKKMLEKNGISTYFSGCMTLTLNKFEGVKKQDYICIVDANEDIIKKVRENTNKEVRVISHNRKSEEMKAKTIETRMNDVENQLKEYQAASLIVTDRLHVALPALALETPVILIRNQDKGNDRIKTFERYLTHYQMDEFLNKDIKELINNPKENKSDYIEIRNNLINLCKEFIKKSENNNKLGNLPDVNDYKNNIDNIRWHNNLFSDLKKKLELSVEKNYYDVKDLWDSCKEETEKVRTSLLKEKEIKEKEIQEKEIEIKEKEGELKRKKEELKRKEEELKKKDIKIDELQSELEKIYNSRTWKIREKIIRIGKKN